MKKLGLLFVSLIICASLLVGCGNHKLSGKYTSDTLGSSTYYEFDGKGSCKLVASIGSTPYVYTINEEDVGQAKDDNGNVHNLYTVHISATNSSGSHKLVFDSYANTIWDPDIGLFSK